MGPESLHSESCWSRQGDTCEQGSVPISHLSKFLLLSWLRFHCIHRTMWNQQNPHKQSIPVCPHFIKQREVTFMITFKKKKSIIKTFIQFGSIFLLLGLVEWGEEAFAELFLKNCTFDQYWQENNFSLWGLQALFCLRKKKNKKTCRCFHHQASDLLLLCLRNQFAPGRH